MNTLVIRSETDSFRIGLLLFCPNFVWFPVYTAAPYLHETPGIQLHVARVLQTRHLQKQIGAGQTDFFGSHSQSDWSVARFPTWRRTYRCGCPADCRISPAASATASSPPPAAIPSSTPPARAEPCAASGPTHHRCWTSGCSRSRWARSNAGPQCRTESPRFPQSNVKGNTGCDCHGICRRCRPRRCPGTGCPRGFRLVVLSPFAGSLSTASILCNTDYAVYTVSIDILHCLTNARQCKDKHDWNESGKRIVGRNDRKQLSINWIPFSHFQACLQNEVCVQRLTAMNQLTKTYISCSNRFTNTNDHQ